MQTIASRGRRRTPAEREKILKAYRRSKLPQRRFAAQAGIGLSTLGSWLRKSAPQQSPSSDWIELPNLVSTPPSQPVYRVHLPNGVKVELGTGFGPEEVGVLLGLLEAR